MSPETILRPEMPPGFLLQLGRVIVRGSELEQEVTKVVAVMRPSADQQLPKPAQHDATNSGGRTGNVEHMVHGLSEQRGKESIEGWLRRSCGALGQRDQLVGNAWRSPLSRPHPAQISPADVGAEWTEERLSALAADMVELIAEASKVSELAAEVPSPTPSCGFPPSSV